MDASDLNVGDPEAILPVSLHQEDKGGPICLFCAGSKELHVEGWKMIVYLEQPGHQAKGREMMKE